ncbi:MAG: MFS transporter [Candidatus Peregrinibacteria bacterium]
MDQDKKTIRVFGWAAFLNDFGAEMIYPLWPFFVTTFLGANMAVLGFIDGLGEALVSISQAVSGHLADKWQKKKVFIWLGYVCGGLSRLGYALSTVWPQLIPFKILDRVGKIRGAPRDAMLADMSVHENRGRHFGFLRTMDNFGAVCGILFSILLFKWLGYKMLFLIAAIPSFIAALLVFNFLKEKKSDVKIYKGLRLKDLDRNFKRFLFLSALFALGSFSYSFLLIYAKGFGIPLTLIPLLYLLFNVMASLSAMPFGRFADAVGRKPALMSSLFLWILVCFAFIAWHNMLGMIIAFVLYGLHKGGLDTLQKVMVAELAPAEYRASALGGFQMVIGLAALPASLLAGVLWDTINPLLPLYISMGLTTVAVLLLCTVKENTTN